MSNEMDETAAGLASIPNRDDRESFLKWLNDLDTRGSFILIDKSAGPTSFDAIRSLKRFFRDEAKKVGINLKERDMPKLGHIGTLDPFATGLLCILCGPSVKLTRYLIGHSKRYVATLRLGEKTDSGDLDGAIISKNEVSPQCFDINRLNAVFETFTNTSSYVQTAPLASAKKVNGKRLYEIYHSGRKQSDLKNDLPNHSASDSASRLDEQAPIDTPVTSSAAEIDRPLIASTIFELKLVNVDEQTQSIQFEVKCSSGTYVRTLGEDIAKKLQTCGHLTALRRTHIAELSVSDSSPLDGTLLRDSFRPMNELFRKIHDLQMMPVNKDEAKLIFHGNVTVLPILQARSLSLALTGSKVFAYLDQSTKDHLPNPLQDPFSNDRCFPFAILNRNENGQLEFETFLYLPI